MKSPERWRAGAERFVGWAPVDQVSGIVGQKWPCAMAACHLSSSVLLLLCLLCCYALLCDGNSSQGRTATTETTPRLNQALHVPTEARREKEEGKVTLGEAEEGKEGDDSLFDVSIVIPTSGARKWTLHRCLNSLLSHLPLASPLQGVSSFALPSSSPTQPHVEGKRASWEVILVPTIHHEAEEEEEGQQQQREELSITPHLVRDSSRRRNILSALRDNEFTSASLSGEKQKAKDPLPPFQTFYHVPKGNHFTEEGGKPATWLSATLQKILSAPPTTKQAETMEQLSGVGPKEALLLRMYDGKPASNSSHALNLGALLARGRYLLFLEENMAVANKRYGADPLRSMLAAFHSPTSSSLTHIKEEGEGEKDVAVGAVGIVGSKVIYAESDDGAIYHAGIDFMLSPYPKDKTKNDDNLWQTWNHDSEGKENQDNVPMPYHRLQGYSAHDRRVARRMSVLAVSKAGMMLPRQLFYSLNGFAHQHFGEQYMDVDLCLRLRAKLYQRSNDISVSMQFPPSSFVLPAPAYPSELPLAVVYEPNALFLYHEEGEEEADNRRAAIEEYGPEAVAFAKLWSESEQTNEQEKSVITQLWQSEIYDNYAIRGTSLYWNAECGAGEVMGFTTEAIHFMLALEKMIPLHYETSNFDSCKNDLVRLGFPVATQVILSRLERKSTVSSDEATNDKFLVLHRDPGRYHISISTGRLQKPDYIIGRSMFETNSIPSSWRDPANNIVNEIWVPSTFNLQTFASGGVHPEKLHQMPEPVDTFLFDPLSVVSSLKAKEEDGFILPRTASDPPEFRFFSMFKWETRKGWKTLFEAYLEEFEREKNVALYILTRMKSHHKEQYARFLDEFMINHRIDDLSQSPKIVILSEMIPTTKLPSVFATMDCFVLATHGEGWGLPLIESMAMELPVIATNWSGNTEFMTERNSYLISVEELVPQGQPDNEGHLWALPSKQSLKQHMRHVFSLSSSSLLPQSQLLQANQKRKRARSDVLNNYSLEKVGRQVIERLRAIKSDEARFEEAKRANEERRREASSPNTANNWNIWNGWNNNDDAALTPLDEGWRRIKINSG